MAGAGRCGGWVAPAADTPKTALARFNGSEIGTVVVQPAAMT